MSLESPKGMRKLLALAFLLLMSPVAHAALGDPESELDNDRRAMSGVLSATRASASYRVVEYATPGRTVREYVSNDGMIFAIAWQGINHPDLSALLGSLYSEFSEACKGACASEREVRRRNTHHRVEGKHLIVARSGHMRAFSGKAIAPDLMPQGVSEDEIR